MSGKELINPMNRLLEKYGCNKPIEKESILWEAIKHYGSKAQMLKAIEECAELIVAIAKNDLPNIAEEVSDVRIMLDQIEIILGIDTRMIRQAKLERLSQRIKGDLKC